MSGKTETNEVRMFGVIPSYGANPIPVGKIPNNGVQIVKHKTIENGEGIIHTVNDRQILYLTAITLTIENAGAALGVGAIRIYDATPAYVKLVFSLGVGTMLGDSASLTFFPPLELEAQWSLRVYSSLASLVANAFLHGYEVE